MFHREIVKSVLNMNPDSIRIKENSILAKIAAKILRTRNMAVVLGKTIHLHNASSEQFRSDRKWLAHELCHIRQFEKYGFWNFLLRYLFESIRNGYRNNRYEAEARNAENNSENG